MVQNSFSITPLRFSQHSAFRVAAIISIMRDITCHCWDFQPNVAFAVKSTAALCKAALLVLFEDSRSKQCAASSHRLNVDLSQTMPFSICFVLFSESTNPQRMPTVDTVCNIYIFHANTSLEMCI